jgi:arsenate reductase
MLSTDDNLITIIYHSEDHIGKEILAYAQTENMPIRDIDISKTKVSETNWAGIAKKLGIGIKDLINMKHPNYMQHYGESVDLSDHDFLKLLEHNPDTLRAPIVMKGEKIQMMENPQDMVHFDFN